MWGECKIYRRVIITVLWLIVIFVSASVAYAVEPEKIDDNIKKGLQWLSQSQLKDGFWSSEYSSSLNLTADICNYMTSHKLLPDEAEKAKSWLVDNTSSANLDFIARLLPYMDEQQHQDCLIKLLEAQNDDGGWGISEGYASASLDTYIVLKALLKENTEKGKLYNAVDFLLQSQNSDGGWSYVYGQESNIKLSSEIAILLNDFTVSTKTTSYSLEAALKRAGEYIVSKQLNDKTWGLDKESVSLTMLCYMAMLSTLGYEPVREVEEKIISLQDPDGSWFGDSYITLLALYALEGTKDIYTDKIESIHMVKLTVNEIKEADEFGVNESIGFDAAYNSLYKERVKLYMFIKAPDGSILAVNEKEGMLIWNTGKSVPGSYTAIAQLKDINSGKITASLEKEFTIKPVFTIDGAAVRSEPSNTRLNQPIEAAVTVTVFKTSNIEEEIEVAVDIADQNGAVVQTLTKKVHCPVLSEGMDVIGPTFLPEVDKVSQYSVTASVYYNGIQEALARNVIKILPPLPPSRVDLVQGLDKYWLYPGEDDVTATFSLNGVGTPVYTIRDPIDMILVLDTSGSMGGKPVKDMIAASKNLIDLLQPQDRGSIITFASSSYLLKDFTSDKEILKASVDGLRGSGGTNIGGAIAHAVGVMDKNSSSDRQKIILLLSDGGSDRNSAVNNAISANGKGIVIHTVGIGSGVDENLLKDVAKATGGIYKLSPTSEQINDMMIEIGGQIFNVAGKDIVFTVKLPSSENISTTLIVPAPDNTLDNSDGSKTLTWNIKKLVMGQQKSFQIKFHGKSLATDTIQELTQSAGIIYTDDNGAEMVERLEKLDAKVCKYALDNLISLDKSLYSANEDVNMEINVQNLMKYDCKLSGVVLIEDMKGNAVKSLSVEKDIEWKPQEIKTFRYTWNVGKIMAGSYRVRVTWNEEGKHISTSTKDFTVAVNGGVSNKVSADKPAYRANEISKITETVINTSRNAVAGNLTVILQIKDSMGNVVKEEKDDLLQIISGDSKSFKKTWSIGQIVPGEYIVTSTVYGKPGESVIQSVYADGFICHDEIRINVIPTFESGYGISGKIEVATKAVTPLEDIVIRPTVTNTGNSALDNMTRKIRIIDVAAGKEVGCIENAIGLSLKQTLTDSVKWTQKGSKAGNYIAVLEAVLPNGLVKTLGSDNFKIEQDTTNSKPVKDDLSPAVTVAEPVEQIPGAIPQDLALEISADKKIYKEKQDITCTIKYANRLETQTGDFEIEAGIPENAVVIDAGGGTVEGSVIKWRITGFLSKGFGKRVYIVRINEIDEPQRLVDVTAKIKSSEGLVNTGDDQSKTRVAVRSERVGKLVHTAYIKGYPDKEFKSNRIITRAEIAVIFARLLDVPLDGKTGSFTDIKADSWFSPYVEAAVKAGIFQGYSDKTFKAEQGITRAEMAIVISRYMGLGSCKPMEIHFSDIENHSALNCIESIYRLKIIQGFSDGSFKPDNYIKRAEAVTMVNGMLYRGPLITNNNTFIDVTKDDWEFGQVEESAVSHEAVTDDEGREIISTVNQGV